MSDGTARLVVKHPDGHFTYHIGLPANGLAVQKEQAVKTGDKLASASGQVYFALVTRFPDGVYVSEPVTFYNGEPPERIEPRTGVTGVVRNKVATAAPAAAAPKVAPTAPAPASVPVATALRPKAEPADDPHPWFLPIGFAVTILVAVWGAWVTRKPQRATAKRPGNRRQQDQLLRQCGGDRGQMQRLIAYEQRRQPGSTPEQAARSALENSGPRTGTVSMGLRECTECQRQLWDQATTCPHCGWAQTPGPVVTIVQTASGGSWCAWPVSP